MKYQCWLNSVNICNCNLLLAKYWFYNENNGNEMAKYLFRLLQQNIVKIGLGIAIENIIGSVLFYLRVVFLNQKLKKFLVDKYVINQNIYFLLNHLLNKILFVYFICNGNFLQIIIRNETAEENSVKPYSLPQTRYFLLHQFKITSST